jgi:hypothetical protein
LYSACGNNNISLKNNNYDIDQSVKNTALKALNEENYDTMQFLPAVDSLTVNSNIKDFVFYDIKA